MASFNRVILAGRVTRDPEVRHTNSGTAVTEIGLAVNRHWKDRQSGQAREDVTFVNVTLWGRTAEIAGQFLCRGRPCLIEGRLQMEQWQDRQTGQTRSTLKVIGESMQLLGPRPDGLQQKKTRATLPVTAPADDFYTPATSSDDVPF